MVVVSSLKERIFCAGANIFMLGSSSHPFKVNFCKYTNETRLGLEDASANSGIKFLAALNDDPAYAHEVLALATDAVKHTSRLLFEAGVDAVNILDPFASSDVLSPEFFREFGLPYFKDIFGYDERQKLLAGAFAFDLNVVEGRRLLLVDDLYRSGATAAVVAQGLIDAGTSAVYFLAITKTRTRA